MITPLLVVVSLWTGTPESDVCKPHLQIRIGGAATCESRPSYDEVDHTAFELLLQRFVTCDGMVGYAAWQCDATAMGQLYDYLISLGCVDVTNPNATRQGEIAYHINAYNALVLYGILHEYPTASIQRHQRGKDGYHIFDDLLLWIDGEYLSLNDIEHGVLRYLEEPRIHFAIVCAAMDCPRLRNEAYTPKRLDEQLADNARDFFSSRQRFRYSKLKRTLYLSSILRWFGEDFGSCEEEILTAIFPYLPCDAQVWLAANPCPKLKFLGYNWALNDACPSLHQKLAALPYRLYATIEPAIRPFQSKAEATDETAEDEELEEADQPETVGEEELETAAPAM